MSVITGTAKKFVSFEAAAPTAFHAALGFAGMLEGAGYTRLNETEAWKIAKGGKYYVTRNQSSVIAFRVPRRGAAPFQIAAAHSDSPMFKLKCTAEDTVLGKYIRLNVEKYGGMIMSSWFDRPLSIAGRVIVRQDGGLQAKIIDLGRDAALIPNMPIHFCREINDGYKFNPQVDLLPLYGGANAKGNLARDIAAAAGVKESEIVASDLFLYNRTPASFWGDGAYFSCPRIDDLECAYAAAEGFLAAGAADHISVCAVFDNEEVGSTTKQGAAGTFLSDVMNRCLAALGATDAETRAFVAASFMVSADNAHAVHPNHPEKYDVGNRTFMNEGVVIKANANQKYTTDAVSDAIFGEICRAAKVPVQHFANRSDVPGGGTLGNISNTQVSMNTVDIGLPQLAMHSAYETAGVKDADFMTKALKAFFDAEIVIRGDGLFSIG